MEMVNKSFDVNEKFGEIEKIFETFKENGHSEEYEGMAIKVVNGLTDILKKIEPARPNTEIVNRVCEFIDKGKDDKNYDALWKFSCLEKGCSLIFFLKELVRWVLFHR